MNKHKIFLILTCLISGVCISQKNVLDEQGRRHGHWKVDFEGTNKTKFEGTYEHGKQTGSFVFFKKGFYDHPSAIMDFKEDQDSVEVTYYTQTGKPISQGKMIDRKREGKWLYFHQDSDSIMMSENYRNDQLNGEQITYFKSGKIAEKTEYSNGQKNGESIIYAANGKVTKELQFKNGKLDGPAKYYNSEGDLIMEGSYAAGKKTGQWKYYSDGKLESEETY